MTDMELFGSSGTRGVANETLTPAFVLRVARATATVLGADRIALARDTRTSGEMLANAAASGLASTGADIDRLGVIPTPGLQIYADREGVPGLMITASHNPAPYNGIKLFEAGGRDLPIEMIEAVESAFLEESFVTAAWDETGVEHRIESARRAYRETVIEDVDRDRIASADLTVAIDPGHGAGTLTSPDLFADLGCAVRTVHAQSDGRFPGRDPEPAEANLKDLQRLVKRTDADVGIAHDGDADRATFVDERGEYITGEAALAALAAAELRPGDVAVSAVNASGRLADAVESAGAELELTRIGTTWIVDRVSTLQEAGEHVSIAGEGNGGIIFPGYRLVRDGAYTAARFLELLADRPASEVVAAYDAYHTVRSNLEYDSPGECDAMLDAVAAHVERERDRADVTTTDGYRLDYDDGWVLARESGTEPLVRVVAEATDPGRAQELLESVREPIEQARE
jgi:phosphomannomutase/phosphoglucomutase